MKKTIESKSSEEIKKLFIELMDFYSTPSFGSVKQREFDIFLFGKLQDIGIFDTKNDTYEVVSKLKITRSKARNLIYENNLRHLDIKKLDEELKERLESARFLKSNNYLISLEIENPLLIDHLKSKLKNLGYSSDGSFSPDIVKLNTSALAALIQDYLNIETQKEIKKEFIRLGYENDKSFKGLIKSFFIHISKKVAGKAGETILEEYITPLLTGSIKDIAKIIEENK